MNIEILTLNDLRDLKQEILEVLREDTDNKDKVWMRSAEVRKMLHISAGTLQNLRINGTIPFTKLGSTIFYEYEEIIKILQENKSA